jgi:TonB-dependent starch-binding outer membrane protein SusC
MKYNHFKLKLRAFAAVLAMLVFGLSANAQQTSVSGIVKDAKTGETILGASILEKGTSKGVITNIDGAFTISVPSNATLVVKYLGYLSVEVPVAGKTNFTIQLREDAISLGEVVAIGYGTVKKNDATGSLTAIKPDKLNKGLTTNAQDMIVGKIAGVSVITDGGAPGGGATIRIRGGSSLNASNDPLIVIDGLTMDNNSVKGVSNLLGTINPNDIESFTVLKDASATAIYGSRASNGVIIITTKKGEKNSKPRVSYDGNTSISTVGKTIKVMSGDQDAAKLLGTENTTWQDHIYQTALSHDHNLSVSGGIKNMPYRASFGYTNQDGIIKTSNFERYTGSFNLSPSLFTDHLKINLNGKGMHVRNQFVDGGGVVGAAAAMDPTQAVTSTSEPYATQFGGYWQWVNKDAKGDFINWNNLSSANPVATLMQRQDISNATDYIGNAEFDYKVHFLPELRVHLNLGIDDINSEEKFTNEKTATADFPHGSYAWEKGHKSNKSLNFYLQYNKEFSNQKFDIMGGYEWQHFYRDGSRFKVGLDNFVFQDAIFNWATEYYLVSYFGRLNYTIADKYLFTATLRDDGTSRFSSKNRWGLFPSAAFAWKINQEGFLKDNNTISDLKLRLGYGVTGQQDINQGDYPYIPVYQTNQTGAYYQFGNTYYQTARPNAYNADLKWEQTKTYNAGIDLGILNSRFTGSVDYYYRNTTDLLNSIHVPVGTNFSNVVLSNVGSLRNQGVEITVNAKAISTKNCTLDLGYNLTMNYNKITKLTTSDSTATIINTGNISDFGTIQAYKVGFPTNSFLVYQQVYSVDGKPIQNLYVDRNGDGKITSADMYLHHKPAADVTMGFSSKLIYKNFDFGMSWRASFGNYVYNDYAANNANLSNASIYRNGALNNKPQSALETNFSSSNTNYKFSDYYVENASFLRCDNITVGYSFKNLFKFITSGRISATVQNPVTITKYKGLDPEVSSGIDNNIYPRPIVTVFGLSLNF